MNAFDLIIVGKGLIGSAATRYLSSLTKRVAVIGSDEPANPEGHTGVFASHYDQRRLTRLSGRTQLWVDLAKRASQQITRLEAASGQSFFEPVGVLIVRADHLKDKYLESPVETLTAANVKHRFYPAADRSWRQLFPDYDFPVSHSVIHEAETAGMINPRKLIKVQLELAQRQGATVIPKEVTNLEEHGDGVELTCEDGITYLAKKVLVCAGAFTNFHDLLPRKLALSLKTEVILLAEVSALDAARLKALPTLSYSIEHSYLADIYLTPPVPYEEAKYYFKMGANTFVDSFPSTISEVQAWFRSGDSDAVLPILVEAIKSILPKVRFESFQTKRCIVTRTPNGYPMIDQVSERLFVATGGNGVGAKTADTLGFLAAGLAFDGRWLDYPREPFRAVYA